MSSAVNTGLPEVARQVSVLPSRIAIVHDWLPEIGGAERVLEQMLRIFPSADLFTLVDFISSSERGFLQGRQVRTSFLQSMPGARRFYRFFLPLMPLAVEHFDLSSYDLVVSSSYAVAKGVITGPRQLHLCYCHSPIRYAWDLQEQYLRQTGCDRGFRGFLARALLHYIRLWDSRTSNGVDSFSANSHFVARRIWKIYRRHAQVIYPPVTMWDTPEDSDRNSIRGSYLSLGRLVPYKRVDLLVEAFRRMPHRTLRIIGDGPERIRLSRSLPFNVQLLGRLPQRQVSESLRSARALLFAAEEDFGIAPVEAQSAGTPVIAYGRGGVCETVLHGKTGIFFDVQTPEAVVDAVNRFESMRFDASALRHSALRFSPEVFENNLLDWVQLEWRKFIDQMTSKFG